MVIVAYPNIFEKEIFYIFLQAHLMMLFDRVNGMCGSYLEQSLSQYVGLCKKVNFGGTLGCLALMVKC